MALRLRRASKPIHSGWTCLIRGQHVLGRAAGGEVGQHEGGGRKVILARVQDAARVAGRRVLHALPIPFGPGGQQVVGVAVARARRRDEAVGQKHERVAFLAVPVGGRQRSVGSAAGLQGVDHVVHAPPKVGVLGPSQRVSRADEELRRVGGKHLFPAALLPGRVLDSGKLAETQHHVVEIGVGQEIGGVLVHRRAEKPMFAERNPADWSGHGIGHALPRCRVAGEHGRAVWQRLRRWCRVH